MIGSVNAMKQVGIPSVVNAEKRVPLKMKRIGSPTIILKIIHVHRYQFPIKRILGTQLIKLCLGV
ncbi:hypothetical protein HBB04_03486 [Pseudomonas coronafaciens]|nr:hypothetical protein HBB04_03486 [Pseudomonas coronafaciens]